MLSFVVNKIFLVLMLAYFSQALYEDQIGKFDWKKEFVGIPKTIFFDTTLSVGKYVLIQSEENTIACLSARNGQIIWRKVLGDDDGQFIKSIVFDGSLITLTSAGLLQSWQISKGNLKWEEDLTKDEESYPIFNADMIMSEISYSEGNCIVVLTNKDLFVVTIPPDNDPITKTIAVNMHESSTFKLYKDLTSFKFVLVELNQGSYISSSIFDLKTHELITKHTIQASWMDNDNFVAMLQHGKLVYYSKDTESFFILNILTGSEESTELLAKFQLNSKIQSLTGSCNPELNHISNHFVVVDSYNTIHTFKLTNTNEVQFVSKIQSKVTPKIISTFVSDENYFFSITEENKMIRIEAISSTKNSKDDLSIFYKLPEAVGSIQNVFINLFLKKSPAVGFRAMLLSSDGSLIMLTQPSRIAWQREESLSDVVATEMLDLPLSDLEAKIEVEFQQSEQMNIIEMFTKRIEAQVQQLQSFSLQLIKEIQDGTLFQKKSRDPLIQEEDMIRDQFSLHKMIVLVTKKGKVFGVDSLSGQIIWQFLISFSPNSVIRLFVQRTTAHFPNPPHASIIVQTENKNPTIVNFNPITGKVLQVDEMKLKSNILQMVFLPFTDTTYLRPVIILDTNLNVHLHPDSDEIRNKINTMVHPFYIYIARNDSVTGYQILNKLTSEKQWIVTFPNNQILCKVSGKQYFEKIDSIGRPLANRSVIYKYINPNAIAVVTESLDKNIDRAFITLYLLDAITGHVLHSTVHKKATSPVYIVHSENWLLYSYRNTKARRYEAMSVELYEGSKLYNGTVFSSFHTRPNPIAMQQSYILPGNIKTIGVSRTERGLTSRQIIFGFSRGVILGLPRRFFDPRRPIKQEQSHREEGLIQYQPEIPLPTEMFLNYNQTVTNIKAIHTCASALESTSIVFVTGLDLFFTRTQPSKMFDVLKEDFDYLLIGTVLLGMLIAVIITKKLSQNKKLNRAWK